MTDMTPDGALDLANFVFRHEFWRLAKTDDDRAMLFFTEEQYNAIRNALSRPAVPEVTDDDLRALWYAHGGVIEGLHVEKGVMLERDLLLFLRALRTIDAPAVPEGYKLVPMEPTDEICEALEECLRDHGFDHDGIGELSKAACWDAMLAAAHVPADNMPPRLPHRWTFRIMERDEWVVMIIAGAGFFPVVSEFVRLNEAGDLSAPARALLALRDDLEAAPAEESLTTERPEQALHEFASLVSDVTAEQPLSRDQIRDVFLEHGFTIKPGNDDLKPYVYEAAEALLAAAGVNQQLTTEQPEADCYSNDDGDTWHDCPDDIEFVQGLSVGDEYELLASVRAWPERFRVTKVPDETDDEYRVEPVREEDDGCPTEGARLRREWRALRAENADLKTQHAIDAQTIQELRSTDWAAKLVEANRENAELRERVKELAEIIGDIKRWDISNLLLDIPHPLRKRMQAVLAAMQEGKS